MANQVSYRYCNATLNSDTLPEYKKTIEEWSLALDEDADLLLYGCEVTLDGKGSSFVQELSQVTQADISASVDDTGISGDWELETAIGEIEATSVFTQEIEVAYQHDLADGDFGLIDFPDFNNTDFNNTSFDFNNVSSDNLTFFAEAGLDFSTVDPSTLNNIDFNEVPVEDLSILADAGLGLEPLNSEELSEINLDVLKGLDYVEGVEFSAVESVSGETTFAQLSDSVTTNANLFNYKDPTLSFDSGLTLDQLSRFNQSDFEALDYAFTGDEAFDADYYLAQNIDVREDGVNPFTHYVNNGVSEGRDPNATFDTSFYIEQNPDVKDAGVNPFEQYLGFAATDEIVRYPNQTAKSFGTSSGVLVASADLSDSQFINFQDSASLLADGNDDVAFALPIVIVVGVKVIAFTAASLGIIKAASNIQELVEANEPEIFVPEGDIDPSIPPFDLSEVPRYDPERFPNNNDFLDDILDGRFEFPDAEEGGSYFLSAERATLIEELAEEGIKHNPEDIVEIDKTPGGKIIFLETGNSKAGLEHIKIEHGDQFTDRGIAESEIPGVVMDAVTKGKIVGYQGSGEGRPIYETTINGKTERLAVTVGSNGFIVGANFQSMK